MNGIFIYKQNNHDTTGNSVMLVILSMYVFNRLLIFSIPLSFVRSLRFFALILSPILQFPAHFCLQLCSS